MFVINVFELRSLLYLCESTIALTTTFIGKQKLIECTVALVKVFNWVKKNQKLLINWHQNQKN